MHAQRITNTTLLDGNVTCAGVMVVFTCETVGSPGLAWSSEQYIGPGGTEISFIAHDFTTQPVKYSNNHNNPGTSATLTGVTMDNGVQTLTSKLHIIASASKSTISSVTCRHTDDDLRTTQSFQVFGK